MVRSTCAGGCLFSFTIEDASYGDCLISGLIVDLLAHLQSVALLSISLFKRWLGNCIFRCYLAYKVSLKPPGLVNAGWQIVGIHRNPAHPISYHPRVVSRDVGLSPKS